MKDLQSCLQVEDELESDKFFAEHSFRCPRGPYAAKMRFSFKRSCRETRTSVWKCF